MLNIIPTSFFLIDISKLISLIPKTHTKSGNIKLINPLVSSPANTPIFNYNLYPAANSFPDSKSQKLASVINTKCTRVSQTREKTDYLPRPPAQKRLLQEKLSYANEEECEKRNRILK